MEKLIVDRFEGDKAVCEKADKSMVDVPKTELPNDVSEGDSLVYDGSTYRIDHDETKKRAQRIAERMDSVFKD